MWGEDRFATYGNNDEDDDGTERLVSQLLQTDDDSLVNQFEAQLLEDESQLPDSRSKHAAPISSTCQAAFAYHSERLSGSFAYVGKHVHGVRDPQKKYTWGWTNGPLSSSNYAYSFDLVTHQAPAGEDWAVRGKKIGEVMLDYSGEEAILVVEAGKHLSLNKTYAYVGGDRLPRVSTSNGNSVETIEPSSFPLVQTSSTDATERTHTFVVVDFEDQPVHVVAYAIICGDFEAHNAASQAAEPSSQHVRGASHTKDASDTWFGNLLGTVRGVARNLLA